MTVLTGFDQGAQVTQAPRRPGLAAAFEPALALQARRFHRPGANRPAALGHHAITHAARMFGEIVLFPLNHLARLTLARWESGDGF